MNIYLSKIAETGFTAGNRAEAAGIGAAGAFLASIPLTLAAAPVAHGALKKISDPSGVSETTPEMLNKYVRDNKLKVRYAPSGWASQAPSEYKGSYLPPTKRVSMSGTLISAEDALRHSPTPAVAVRVVSREKGSVVGAGNFGYGPHANDALLHELGHVKDMGKRTLAHKAKVIAASPLAKLTGHAAAIALLTDEDTAAYAPAAALAGHAGTLRSEFVANKNAYDFIKAEKGVSSARKALRRVYLPAMGTYLIGAALPTAAYGAGALASKEVFAKKREGNAYLEKAREKRNISTTE